MSHDLKSLKNTLPSSSYPTPLMKGDWYRIVGAWDVGSVHPSRCRIDKETGSDTRRASRRDKVQHNSVSRCNSVSIAVSWLSMAGQMWVLGSEHIPPYREWPQSFTTVSFRQMPMASPGPMAFVMYVCTSMNAMRWAAWLRTAPAAGEYPGNNRNLYWAGGSPHARYGVATVNPSSMEPRSTRPVPTLCINYEVLSNSGVVFRKKKSDGDRPKPSPKISVDRFLTDWNSVHKSPNFFRFYYFPLLCSTYVHFLS